MTNSHISVRGRRKIALIRSVSTNEMLHIFVGDNPDEAIMVAVNMGNLSQTRTRAPRSMFARAILAYPREQII